MVICVATFPTFKRHLSASTNDLPSSMWIEIEPQTPLAPVCQPHLPRCVTPQPAAQLPVDTSKWPRHFRFREVEHVRCHVNVSLNI